MGLNGQKDTYDELLTALAQTGGQEIKVIDLPIQLTMEELRQGRIKRDQAIISIKAKFKASVLVRDSKDASKSSTSHFSMVYAEKGEKRFKSYTSNEATPAAKKVESPDPDFLYAYNGRHMKDIAMRARSGGFRKSRTANFADLANLLFETISYFVDEDREKSKLSTIHVPTALSAVDRYRLLPKLQLVDGYKCHVVTSGPDTLWIDAEQGFVVRRRVLFRQASSNDPGVLRAVYVAQQFQKFSDDVWLPEKTRRLDFATQKFPPQEHGKLLGINEFNAKWEVNNVPDSQFDLSFPPGFLVTNYDNNTEFFAPAGEELLDDAISTAGKMPGIISNDDKSGHFRLPALLIANLIAVVVLLFLLTLRWLKNRNPSGV